MKHAPLVIALATLGACTFRPDYSGYEKCDDQFHCADPDKTCFKEEGICITLCGEDQPCEPEDAGDTDAGDLDAGIDAGSEDAGLPDGGADAGDDAGTDAGSEDAGTEDAGTIALEPDLPNAVEQLPYQHTVAVEGGVPPFTFTFVDGELPKGISFTLGTLSGTPDDAGTTQFTIEVNDSDLGPKTDQRTYALTVEPRLRVASPDNLPDSNAQPYSEPLLATGGSGAPLTWSVSSGTLPAGLFIDGGTLQSTANFSGSGSFTLEVSDSGDAGQTAARTVTIAKGGGLTFYLQTAGLPDGRLGTPYTYELKAGGGTKPYAWSVPSGSVLPPGLSVAGSTLSGVPTQRGTYTFSIKVDDNNAVLHGSATLNATVTIY